MSYNLPSPRSSLAASHFRCLLVRAKTSAPGTPLAPPPQDWILGLESFVFEKFQRG